MKKTLLISLTLIIVIIGGIIGAYYIYNNIFKPNVVDGVENYSIEDAFPNLNFNKPLGIYHSGDGKNQLYVVEQEGKIYVINNERDTNEKSIFLDISDLTNSGGEGGLLGLAFHLNFAQNGYFYIDYTDLNGDTIISRFKIKGITK